MNGFKITSYCLIGDIGVKIIIAQLFFLNCKFQVTKTKENKAKEFYPHKWHWGTLKIPFTYN